MEEILSSELHCLPENAVGDAEKCDAFANDMEDLNSENYWLLSPRYSWNHNIEEHEGINIFTTKEDGAENAEVQDAYDRFMTKHLQHYGYYTGRNSSFRENFQTLQEWRRNYDVRLSGQRSLSLVEEQLGKNGSHLHNRIIEGAFFSGEGQLPDDLLHRTTQLVFHYHAGRKIPKLREPRNLYALTKEAGPQQATRWPSHVQVVCPAIRFLETSPPTPEPLNKVTGKEPTPSVRGGQLGEVIYFNDPGRDIYFMRSRVAGCRLAVRSTTLTPPDFAEDNYTLEFESRFESGNLLKVDKITDFDYELTLRTDLYTSKHTQWYFFRVRNTRPGKTYRFTIVNLMKPSSLYNHGMRPVLYSEINAKKNKVGWTRYGTNVRYYRNNLCSRDGRNFYSLTWQCEFPHKDDTCYFAHCYPYTYTDLQEYLLDLANDPVRSRFCKQRVLCRTLAGNLVYILTITSPSRNPEISREKRAVVLSARVHPGETNSSWMMKGFLDYLTGSSADAKLLRDTFIFKIVPMLNPDGVIVGNYRCSLAGRDLNRNYKSVLKDSFPSIWHTKTMVKRLRAEREVVLYCDLHGHSRKNNIFIYGCENKHQPQKRLQERIFPLMLSKNAHQAFSFDSCKYKVQKSKEGTGRIVMWCMGIMNSYTLEATFGGTSLPGSRKDTHLSMRDLESMGYHFCDTLLDYCDPDSSKRDACMRELQDRMKRQILKKLRLQGRGADDINLDDYISDIESDTSGSDSSCDDGLPVHLLAIAPKLQRKKKLRTRRERNKVAAPAKPSAPVPSTDTSKQPSHSAKPAVDKSKSIRYSQAIGKKREDHSGLTRHGATSSAAAEDRASTSDRAAKKTEKKPVPSYKSISKSKLYASQSVVVPPASTGSAKTPDSASDKAREPADEPASPRIRMRTGDASRFKIEHFARSVSRRKDPVELEIEKAAKEDSLKAKKVRLRVNWPPQFQNVAKPSTSVSRTTKAVSPGQINLVDMLHYEAMAPSEKEAEPAAPLVRKRYSANAHAEAASLKEQILNKLQELPAIVEGQRKDAVAKNDLPKARKARSAPIAPQPSRCSAKSGPRALGNSKRSKKLSRTAQTAGPSVSHMLKLAQKQHTKRKLPEVVSVGTTRSRSSHAVQQAVGDEPSHVRIPKTSSNLLDSMRHKWFPLRCSRDLAKRYADKAVLSKSTFLIDQNSQQVMLA